MKYVLYHSNCYDGFGAAFAAWLKLGDEAQYIPVTYGEPPPVMEEGSEVWIVDFAYPREVLLELAETRTLRVLDHHATAKEALSDLKFATFNLSKSGASLAWKEFHGKAPLPKLLAYIEDRDLWKFKLGDNTKYIHALLVGLDMNFLVWQNIMERLENEAESVIVMGRSMYEFQQKNVAKMCQESFIGRILQYQVPMVNATCSWSEVGQHLLDKYPNAAFVASYFDTASKRVYSLRSRKGFDVGQVAKLLGGGGHPQAAGFQINKMSPNVPRDLPQAPAE